MKSAIVKRSISVGGHKTSVSLEAPFWDGLKEIAELRSLTVSQVVAEIDAHRHQGNLSSTIRLFVLDQARANAGASMGAVAPMPSAMHGG
jgi:predicted DNA-binding ribbon-helix-helix protein